MTNSRNNLVFVLIASLLLFSCKKEKEEKAANEKLFQEATAGGYTYYQSGALLNGTSPSPHGQFKLRFNQVAQNALANDGELSPDGAFPDGSVIVKELYSNNQLMLLAIMKKSTSDENAGNGWIWAEYKPGGDVAYSLEKKGEGCINCHSGNPHRDLVRTFDLH